MNFARISKLFLVLLLGSALAFAACGEDESDNDANQQQNNDEEDDQCTAATERDDCGDSEICDEDADPNECVEVDCVDDEHCDDGFCNENECVECLEDEDCDDEDYICTDNFECTEDVSVPPAEPTPTCEDDPKPDRCDADADDYTDFGPGSYLDHLAIADPEECCVDFTGGQEFSDDPDAIDNILPEILEIAEDREDMNEQIAEMLDEGDLSIVLEHDGLEEIEEGSEFDINFLFAEGVPEDGEVVVDPVSFEDGTHPHAMVPNAEIVDEGGDLKVYAGPGNVVLSLDLGVLVDGIEDVDLNLTISNAMLRADITDDSSIDDGVGLENGELGGLVRLDDIAAALNEFGATCDCLDNPDEIIATPDGEDAYCALDDDVRDDADDECTDDEDICGEIAGLCDAVVPLMSAFTDIDTTGDGNTDAFSAGIEFGAEGVTIVEVGEGELLD